MRKTVQCVATYLNKVTFFAITTLKIYCQEVQHRLMDCVAVRWAERGITGRGVEMKGLTFVLVLVCGLILSVTDARADSGPLRGLAGKCVDVTGAISADGTPLVLWSCHGGFNQQWELRSDRTIRGLGGKCLDVAGGNVRDGTPLILWSCHGGPNQQWEARTDGTIRGLGGKCLDVFGGKQEDGTPLILWSCHGKPNQLWSAGQATGREVWGFADLHAHPASHLAFGADTNGENGIFHGKPGLKFSDAQTTIVNDLKACSPDKHSGFTLDPAEHEIRKTILKIADGMGGGLEHQASGAPDFKNWPAARSITHQQMHISDIRRAYDGGLRLLVASVTNNELLHKAWHANTGTLADLIVNTKLPRPDFGFDFDSAVKQISFIKTLVSSNADWMEIVLTAQQARNAIQSGKLAIVLGLEMDSLTLKQILDLVDNHGVRQVIPIHLADNGFGGAAVYEESFNYNTEWLNARFFSVGFDPKLRFRLKKPDGRVSDPSDKRLPPETLNYLIQPGGHKNANGLFGHGFSIFELMRKGVLLDVAHMGANSIDDTLKLALNEGRGYPVMDSHTGLRDDQQVSESERHLSFSQAEKIRQLGGVIGVGATGDLIAPLPNPCDVAGRNQCIADAEVRFRECKEERDLATDLCDRALLNAREECDRKFCGAHSPVSSWLDGYNVALDHMGSRGVALGTDTNGLSPLIPPGSGGFVTYPFAVAQAFSPPPTVVSSMDRHRIGSRQFNFHLDGIATYGMLPDFLQALNNMSAPHDPKRALKAIYRSAEDTIQMWEKVEAVAKTLSASCTPGLKACSGKCVNLALDEKNCGACGNTCSADQLCNSGVCKQNTPTCPSGKVWCDDTQRCQPNCF